MTLESARARLGYFAFTQHTRKDLEAALDVAEAARRLRDVGPQINMPASSMIEMLEAVKQLDHALDRLEALP